MGITVYAFAPSSADDGRRERAVEVSGALDAINDPVLQEVVEAARRCVGTAMAAVSIVHGEWQYLIATSGLRSGPYARRTSFCGHVVSQSQPLFVVPDTLADARFADNPAVGDPPALRFYAAARLVGPDGMALGALCVFDPKPRAEIKPAERTCLLDLADRTMARITALG